MKNRKKTAILLKRLAMKECEEIFQLSQEAIVFGNFLQDLSLNGERGRGFTQRLLWLAKAPYTIRSQYEPEKIIGYALLYKSGTSYYHGICIRPDCHHPTIIDQTREQIAALAKFCYNVCTIRTDMRVYYTGSSVTMPSLVSMEAQPEKCISQVA